MPPRNAPPQKKPSGGRPLHRRLMSSDSQMSNVSSGSSEVPVAGGAELRRLPRRPSKSSTLGLVEQDDGGKADPFSDSPGFEDQFDRTRVRSPDSELEYHSYPSGVTSPVSENTPSSSSSRQHSRPSLPLASEPQQTVSSMWADKPVVTSPQSGSNMFSGRPDATSSLSEQTRSALKQRSRRPQALASQTRSPSPQRNDNSTIRSPLFEEDTFSIQSGMTSPVSEKSKISPKIRSWKPLAPASQSRPTSPSGSESSTRIPPSPSKARWEHVRQHVLPSTSRPAAIPTPAPPVTSIPRSSTPLQQAVPARAQAMKPSRFARLGFKHVVEHMRDVTIVDDNRRFADEVLKVCWQARFMEPTKGSRAGRDPILDSGASNLYLPFMSNSSLANTNDSSSTLSQLNQKKTDLKRPQSVQSLALANRQVPTVRYIHVMLLHYANPSAEQPKVASFLPNEPQLLSALLTPFTTRTAGSRADEERWFSVESFEIAVKTWKAATNQVSLLVT